MHLLNSCTPHPHNPDIVFRDCRSWDVPRFSFNIVQNFVAPNQALNPLLMPLHLTSLCLVGSCNGLLCFINLTAPFCLVHICNPCTGETTQFPLSSSKFQNDFFSFGHDPILDHYKVVAVNTERVGEVWTLGSGLWRTTTDVPFIRTAYMDHLSYVSLNGALHWISQEGAETMQEGAETIGIASFHIASEEFQFVPLPIEVSSDPIEFICIGTLQGFISIAKLAGFGFDQVEVWATNNHKLPKSWSKQCVVKANLLCQMSVFGNWDVLLDDKDMVVPDDIGLHFIADGTNFGLDSIVKITEAFVHVGTLVSPIKDSQVLSV